MIFESGIEMGAPGTKLLQTILPEALICMDDLAADHPGMRTECAYARADNLLFGERIYRPEAKIWLHEDLASIVMGAADLAVKAGYRLVLYDGLRTVEAQEKMLQTRRVRENPQWLEEPRLLSPPGAGAHPRAMAIDLSMETAEGVLLDMGTPFDFLAANAAPESNPAHRLYAHSVDVMHNRAFLDGFMKESAQKRQIPVYPLPQEWWDYRLPRHRYEKYAPLSDAVLLAIMRMCVEERPFSHDEDCL
ncbi:MAG: D-alanyl-D-alanine carboxypeptidase family protein [Alphaproteobacteria bacterium]|nr:D-alanyl-D-alanine carboxypeptidase family protein [Alphaproteobacteria bacterium]